MGKQIKIFKVWVNDEKEIMESKNELEKLVNDGWFIVGQCAYGDSQSRFWVTLQKG